MINISSFDLSLAIVISNKHSCFSVICLACLNWLKLIFTQKRNGYDSIFKLQILAIFWYLEEK